MTTIKSLRQQIAESKERETLSIAQEAMWMKKSEALYTLYNDNTQHYNISVTYNHLVDWTVKEFKRMQAENKELKRTLLDAHVFDEEDLTPEAKKTFDSIDKALKGESE